MIYVLTPGVEDQIQVLELVSRTKPGEIAVWFYLKSEAKRVAGLVRGVQNNLLEPVTAYASETQKIRGAHTLPVSFSHSVATELKRKKSEVRRCCDSLALYEPGQNAWVACAIPHERLCLVRDNELFASLIDLGFNASLEAPAWW